jgi:hypothetical protein
MVEQLYFTFYHFYFYGFSEVARAEAAFGTSKLMIMVKRM